jgi:hypothetical protein
MLRYLHNKKSCSGTPSAQVEAIKPKRAPAVFDDLPAANAAAAQSSYASNVA